MNGIMMGLSPREARKRYDSVIEFAELQEFRDLKLKNYSSGMQVRLAFSVAIQVDADILLIDEVLAVGDASFQQKCFDVFHRMREQGKTIVLVTHDMSALRRFCDRALLLERGTEVHLGEPKEVAEQYLEINFGRDPEGAAEPAEHAGDGDARVAELWVEDETGQRQAAVPQGQRITVRVVVDFFVAVEDPQAAVYMLNEDQKAVLVAASWIKPRAERAVPRRRAGYVLVHVRQRAGAGPLQPLVNLAHRGSGLDVMDRFERGFSFVVVLAGDGGIVDLPAGCVDVPGGSRGNRARGRLRPRPWTARRRARSATRSPTRPSAARSRDRRR